MIPSREIARGYHETGYLPIPADCTSKMPKISWGIYYDKYDFDQAWANHYDGCDIAVILKNVVCVDFDRHGDGITSMDYYNWLCVNHPDFFKRAVIEKTQSDGRHVYYRRRMDTPDKKWEVPVKFDDHQVFVEVKTGKNLAYCTGSFKNGKPAYEFIQGSFNEIHVRELPFLPSIYLYEVPKKVITTYKNLGHVPTDKELMDAIPAIVDRYSSNAGITGKMHKAALGMAGYMAGLGYSYIDIERALESYERNGHRNFVPGEIDGIIKFGFDNKDSNARLPYKR